MKMTMRLTLDGMKRALRWKAHELAEDAEQGYRGEALAELGAASPVGRGRPEAGRTLNDDRTGS